MKKPWERAPLDEAVFLQEGPGIRSYEYQKGGYPMINVRCVQDGYIDLSTCNAANVELATGKWKHFQVQEGDILFTISGSIGRTAVVKKKDLPLLMNTSVVRFRSKTTRLRDDFFFYYLQSEDFLGKLHALSSGTAQKNVGPTHLKTLDVPLPPLAEQQRIVGLLDEAFEGLATAKANAEKNLQNARALFESHLQSVFTQRGKSVRAGWHKTKLAELADVQSGAGFPTKFQGKVKGGIPFYKVSDMNLEGNERNMVHENNSITEEVRKKLGASLFPQGSVIFPKIGGAIATNKKRLTTRDCCVDNNVMGAIPKPGRMSSEFLYYFFLAYNLSDFANEAHLPSIKKTVVENWELCVPKTIPEQERIVEQLDSFTEETQRLARLYEQKLAALEALKKSLLHQAFTGQL